MSKVMNTHDFMLDGLDICLDALREPYRPSSPRTQAKTLEKLLYGEAVEGLETDVDMSASDGSALSEVFDDDAYYGGAHEAPDAHNTSTAAGASEIDAMLESLVQNASTPVAQNAPAPSPPAPAPAAAPHAPDHAFALEDLGIDPRHTIGTQAEWNFALAPRFYKYGDTPTGIVVPFAGAARVAGSGGGACGSAAA